MKYKFKAFGAPLLMTIFLVVIWVIVSIILDTPCGISYCPPILPITQIIVRAFSLLIPIYCLLILVNLYFGVKASKKEKQIFSGQAEKQKYFLNNVRTIKNIVRIMIIALVILSVLVVVAFVQNKLVRSRNAKLNEVPLNCLPVYNMEINDFVHPPGC